MRAGGHILTAAAAGLAPALMAQDLPGSAPFCDEAPALSDCELIPYLNVLFFDYEPAEDGATLILRQIAPEGGSRMISDPIAIRGAAGPPAMRDINSDLTEELLIPVAVDEAGQTIALWREGADGFLAPAGEIRAPANAEIAVDGPVFSARLPLDDTRTAESAWMLGAEGVMPVYRLEIDAAAAVCTLAEAPGLEAAALNPEDIVAACEAEFEDTDGPDDPDPNEEQGAQP